MPPKSIAKEVLFFIKIKKNHPEAFNEIVGVLDGARVSLSREGITVEEKKEIDKETVQEISRILLDNKLPKDAEEFSKLYEKSPELKGAIIDSWINDIYDETGTLMEEPIYPRYDAEFMHKVVLIGRDFDQQLMNASQNPTKADRHNSKKGTKGKSKKGGIRKQRQTRKQKQTKKSKKM